MRKNISSGYEYEDEFGYSRAVRAGNFVFVSGTTARQPHLKGDAYVQAQAALETISQALQKADASLQDVVKTVIYVRDMADAPLIARAHSESFDTFRPVSTLVEVSRLTPEEARVEIEVTAIIQE
ncbi:RidA family protein [Chachezhania antarctica]|uniref:RidA family protein n=1 Tax=Chachezhania antarctica TaxID=2340860 RepID=UPI000EAB6E1C|nr:RidA family protein [Chachezhania antarctica]|tara:strand:- start:1123 stop:1497 length:375 start_codon:yes stop_codon:yes gene_type:complete